MFKNVKDYFSDLKDIADNENALQGIVIIVIGLVLFFAPIFAMHHYATKVKQYQSQTAQINAEAKKLNAKTKEKVKYAKVQELNQKQTQAKIEKRMNQFISLQNILLKYQEGKIKDEHLKETTNDEISRKYLMNDGVLGTNSNGLRLVVPLEYGHVRDLSFETGYSPTYSVYQKDINVSFKVMYEHKYIIFVINGNYNLQTGKFESFDTYSTKWTTTYLREPTLIDAEIKWEKTHLDKHGHLKKKMPEKEKRKIVNQAKAKAKAEAKKNKVNNKNNKTNHHKQDKKKGRKK